MNYSCRSKDSWIRNSEVSSEHDPQNGCRGFVKGTIFIYCVYSELYNKLKYAAFILKLIQVSVL